MIITKSKKLEDVLDSLKGATKVLNTGCAECSTVSRTGGENEVKAMADTLTANGFEVVGTVVCEIGCNKNNVKKELKQFKDTPYDAVLVMSCGDGVQTMAGNVDVPVYPASDTMFLGEIERVTLFSQACKICGDCVLGRTAGVCPITKCAKSLVNGPCGGAKNGKCETNPDVDCAWILIYNRLKKFGQLDKLEVSNDDKGHKINLYPATINLKEEKANE